MKKTAEDFEDTHPHVADQLNGAAECIRLAADLLCGEEACYTDLYINKMPKDKVACSCSKCDVSALKKYIKKNLETPPSERKDFDSEGWELLARGDQ